MSPALDMPLNRREALASVIAMLAFVLGAGESDAAGFSTESVENPDPPVQLDPASSKAWEVIGCFFSADAELPNREAGYRTWFEWIDGRLMLTVREHKSERTDPYLVRFELVGDELGGAAEFMDMLSERADERWERDEQNWLEHPRVHCPVCKCETPKRHGCANCEGTGWVLLAPEDAQRSFEVRSRKRRALIDAARTAVEA